MKGTGGLQPHEASYLEWAEQWFNFGPGNKPYINDIEELYFVAQEDFELHKETLIDTASQFYGKDRETSGPLASTEHAGAVARLRKKYEKDIINNKDMPEVVKNYIQRKKDKFKHAPDDFPFYNFFKAFENFTPPSRIEDLRRHIDYAKDNPQLLLANGSLRESFMQTMGLSQDEFMTEGFPQGPPPRMHSTALTKIRNLTEDQLQKINTNYQDIIIQEHEYIHRQNAEYLEMSYEDDGAMQENQEGGIDLMEEGWGSPTFF